MSAKCKSDDCQDIEEIPIVNSNGIDELVIKKNIYINSNTTHKYDIIIELKKDNNDEAKNVELELGVVEVKKRLNQLIYDNQGGSGCSQKTIEVDGKYGNLCTPTKLGYTFIGWYDKKTNGNKVNENTILTEDNNQTIYAYYEKNEYTINFNTNGGSVCDNKTILMDEEYGELCTPSKKGYTFLGWYDKEINGNKITSKTILRDATNKTLYSYWKANEYKVTYKTNKNYVCTPTSVTYGGFYTDLCTPSTKGYTFLGWYTKNGDKVENNSIYLLTSDQELTAKWEAKKYTLTFHNEGESVFKTKEITFDEKYGELYNPLKTGYTFLGWYDDKKNGNKVNSDTILTDEANKVIYAYWRANVYILTYDNNTGSGCTTENIVYDEKYGNLCTPTKKGYTFLGWYTDKDGGELITSDTVVSQASNITLYARYKVNNYLLTFVNPNEEDHLQKTITFDKSYGQLYVPIRKGYTFDGWYDKEIDGKEVNEKTILTEDKDQYIYSHWTANKYTLTYDNNTGSGCENKTVTYDSIYGNLCIPEKVGHSFVGWFTDKENGIQITENTIVNTDNNHTLYAQWTANKYILTFNNPSGMGNETKEIIYAEKYGELYTPVRKGYTFIGWYESEIGGEEITSETILMEASNQNIYSHWTANKYNVTYDNNTGSGCTNKEVTYAQAYGELCTPVKKGYIFTGWFTNKDGTKQITDKTIVDTDMNHTLYAQWTVNTYNLVYNNAGGSGCTTKGVTFGEKYGNLCIPVRSGYTFDGWYNLDNEKVTENDVLIDDRDQILTAHWTANKYTIIYDNENGTGCINKSVTYDLPYGVLCEPEKIGYTFKGWYNENAKIDSATIVYIANDHTLKAKWEANEYTLNYDNVGGSGCINKDVVYDSSYGNLCTPIKSGYTFIGWYTKETSGEKINENTIVKTPNTHTVYAHWQANEYTLTYDNNNGTGCENKTVTYESSYGNLCTPTRVGYTFSGWYTDKNSGEIISEDDIFLEPNNKTIYAQWTANNYTLIYNNNNGSGCTTKVVTYDNAYGSLCTPTRVGYTFDGWYKDEDNSEEITEDTILTDANNQTIYAHWTANKYIITFNKQNGSNGTSSTTATYDKSIADITVPSRAGYTFDGYYTGTNGSGTKYYDIDGNGLIIYQTSSNITLYAHWIANKYTITFNTNGGSGGTTNTQATYDSTLPKITIPTRKDYNFIGYYDNPTNGIQYYDSNGNGVKLYTITSNITLYAQWKLNEVTAENYSTTIKCANFNTAATSAIITYTGNCSISVVDSTEWRMKLTSNGSFSSLIDMNIDAFLVGGGGAGNTQKGGSGGKTSTYSNIALTANTSYSITIGAGGSPNGGSGGTTSAFGKSIAGGSLSSGGSGGSGITYMLGSAPGGSYGNSGVGGYFGVSAGSGQGRTTCEFDEGTLSGCTRGTNYAYAGGGGGAGTGSNGYWGTQPGGVGGGGSSGSGGDPNSSGIRSAGRAGTANRGGGGGAGSTGGKGGSGVVVIRKAK